jgi:hypothetical protein
LDEKEDGVELMISLVSRDRGGDQACARSTSLSRGKSKSGAKYKMVGGIRTKTNRKMSTAAGCAIGRKSIRRSAVEEEINDPDGMDPVNPPMGAGLEHFTHAA